MRIFIKMLEGYISEGYRHPVKNADDAKHNIKYSVAKIERALHEGTYANFNEDFAVKMNSLKFISGKEIAEIQREIIFIGWKEVLTAN